MEYAMLFDDFWNDVGRYEGYNNPSRTRDLIVRKLKDCESIGDIDKFVYSARTGRETRRQIIVKFYDYLRENKGISVESPLCDMEFTSSRIEELFEMAKFLHVRRSLLEIETHFNIDERTRREYLAELEEGVRFMGSTVKIEKSRSGGKDYYECTMHPIFLPLNLTEIYAITKGLDGIMDGSDPNTSVLRDIQERIKAQLTDYAFNKLFPEEKREIRDDLNDYIPDKKMIDRPDTAITYLMKSAEPFRFRYEGEEYEGRFRHDFGRCYVQLHSGETLEIDANEIELITDSIKYK